MEQDGRRQGGRCYHAAGGDLAMPQRKMAAWKAFRAEKPRESQLLLVQPRGDEGRGRAAAGFSLALHSRSQEASGLLGCL